MDDRQRRRVKGWTGLLIAVMLLFLCLGDMGGFYGMPRVQGAQKRVVKVGFFL